jgi:hypothetical protein
MNSHLFRRTALCAAIAAVLASPAQAQPPGPGTNMWINPSPIGYWDDSSNWSQGVPQAGEDAVVGFFPFPTAVTYKNADNPPLNSLELVSFLPLAGDGDPAQPANYQTGISQSRDRLTTNSLTVSGVGMPDAAAGYRFTDGNLHVIHDETIGNGGDFLGFGSAPGAIGGFAQDGGVHTVDNTLSLGIDSGAGYYGLSGGVLTVGSGLIVGNSGVGEFRQDNSQNNSAVISQGLTVGNQLGAAGRYTMADAGTGSSLNLTVTGDETIGLEGKGDFTQNAGIHQAGNLTIGLGAGSDGAYTLKGGTLNTGMTQIGLSSDSSHVATFNQMGGSFATDTLWMANACNTMPSGAVCAPGSFGNYNLFTGTLAVNSEARIGLGGYAAFNQFGGDSKLNQLVVGGGASIPGLMPSAQGVVNLTGGGLHVVGNAVLGAGDPFYWDINQTNGQPLQGGQGRVNQDGGAFWVGGDLVVGQAGDHIGGRGVYILSEGVLTVANATRVGNSDGIGQFNQSGGVHTADQLFIGSGGGKGTYNLGGTGLLNITGNVPGGPDPANGVVYVGEGGKAQFTQSGASQFTANSLNVGIIGGSDGRYDLSGGTLTVNNNLNVGGVGSGAFYQIGGSAKVGDTLRVDGLGGASGHYALSGGVMSANGLIVGDQGVGKFEQSGGAVNINAAFTMFVGGAKGAAGTYAMSGGELNVSTNEEKIGGAGIGHFYQSGGVHDFSGAMYLGDQATGVGEYRLSGGELKAGAIALGEWGGVGKFFQSATDGASSVTVGDLNLARQKGATGTYELSSGTLHVIYSEIVGNQGVGTFTQTGGSHAIDGSLTLGQFAEDLSKNLGKGDGTYNLADGTLSVAGDIHVGEGGVGKFDETAGSLAAANMNVNAGSRFDYSGGSFSLNFGNGVLTNAGQTSLSGAGTRTVDAITLNQASGNMDIAQTEAVFNGHFTNYGTVKLTDSSVTFLGAFTNNGAYISDPSQSHFTDLTVGTDGYLAGGAGDQFFVSGNFTNNSTQYNLWDTDMAQLIFEGGGAHAASFGGTPGGGFLDNFAWGSLILGASDFLTVNGGALYVGILDIADITHLSLNGGAKIYYDATQAANAWLANWNISGLIGVTENQGGGIPEPATLWLMVAGLSGWIGLGARGKRA